MAEEKKEVVLKESNTPALLGFIFSLTVCLYFPGLILSIIGLATAKNYKNDRKGLAIAGIIISGILLLISAGMYSSGNLTTTSNSTPNNSYEVKLVDFSTMTEDEGKNWCDENKITCYSSYDYSDTVEENKLISQSIKKGTIVKKYSRVDLKYSKGRKKSEEEIKNEFIASCQDFSYEDIARNPNNYKGKNAKFNGKVIQVQEGLLNSVTLRVDVTQGEYGIWDDTVYVNYKYKDDNESKILEDDIITMYGTIDGLKTYTTIFGGEVTIPEMTVKYITR